jgi:hypothetical protein
MERKQARGCQRPRDRDLGHLQRHPPSPHFSQNIGFLVLFTYPVVPQISPPKSGCTPRSPIPTGALSLPHPALAILLPTRGGRPCDPLSTHASTGETDGLHCWNRVYRWGKDEMGPTCFSPNMGNWKGSIAGDSYTRLDSTGAHHHRPPINSRCPHVGPAWQRQARHGGSGG